MKHTLPLTALCLLCLAGPAQAGLFGDDEARRQISEIRQDMEGRLDASGRAQIELANQNEALRSEVARLRGQVEILINEVESIKQRQRDFYIDLDSRLRNLEGGGTAATTSQAEDKADPSAESRTYEAALTLLKDGKQREALTALQNFVVQHPTSSYAPGAHFWAGNAALQLKDAGAATSHFQAVLAQWPDDALAPDAMLGLANSQQVMGDAKSAQRTLQSLTERYPNSNAAQQAKQRLNKR